MLDKYGTLETYFGTCIVFLLAWLWKDFFGMWLSVVLVSICLAVLFIASVSEWIEPSRVPRRYFLLMIAIILGICSASAAYLWIFGGEIEFLKN